ncbi:hypothetical protein CI603_07695, partial [Bifidobacterium sp. wkB338]|uniref:RCC1 domain-containing protein n=1 Tax=Bifidobacterium sp. wkB338 TaxID=2025114 RepID=UPI000FF37833
FNSNARSLVPVRVRDPDSTTDTSKGLKVTQVSAGYNYSLAVGSDGYAYAWGHNGFGQLGNDSIPTGQFNSNARSLVPVRVRDPDSTTDTSKGLKVTQVSAGYNYSLAVGSDGYAYAWGHNGFGQLGNDSIPTGQFNSNARSLVPVRVRDPDSTTDTSKGLKVTQVSAGYNYSLAVGSDGYAYAWGHNGFGQLGNDSIPTGQFNSNARSLVPVRVRDPDSTTDTSKGLKVTQVSAGYNYSLAVGSDGYAYAWGHNGFGQLGNDSIPTGQFNSNARSLVPVRVRDPDSTTDTSKGLKVTQVSAGYNYSLAVGSDGYAYAWGHNGFGQLGNDSIPTGQFNSNARSLVPVRVRDPDSTTDTSKGLKVTQVSAGYNYSLAVGSDGYAYAWGHNGFGQLGNDSIPTGQFNSNARSLVPVRVRDPDSTTDTSKGLKVTQVSAGYDHSLAMDSNGNAYAWGDDKYGQLGDRTTIQQTTPVMVKKPDHKTYADLPEDFTYVQVSAGGDHSLAVGSDGYAYAWGYNYYGQLGNNTSDDHSSIPVRVLDPDSPTDASKGLKTIQVSGGQEHSLAVDSEGHVYAWGLNSYGQLGDNTRNNRTIPVKVFVSNRSTSSAYHLLNAVLVSGGWRHSLAISTDGNANAWGENRYGQLGDNSRNDSNVPVPVVFPLPPVITGIRFDTSPGMNLTRGDGSSVTVTTPAHLPGTVTVSVDYTLGGAPQTPDTSLRYTYLPADVLPRAGGQGILLALATGLTGMGGVLASRRHRKEQHQLLHASHE